LSTSSLVWLGEGKQTLIVTGGITLQSNSLTVKALAVRPGRVDELELAMSTGRLEDELRLGCPMTGSPWCSSVTLTPFSAGNGHAELLLFLSDVSLGRRECVGIASRQILTERDGRLEAYELSTAMVHLVDCFMGLTPRNGVRVAGLPLNTLVLALSCVAPGGSELENALKAGIGWTLAKATVTMRSAGVESSALNEFVK